MTYHPLTEYNLLKNGNIAKVVEVGNELFWDNRCQSDVLDTAVAAEFNGIDLGSMALAYLTFAEEVTIEPEFNDQFFLIQTTLDGCSVTRNGDSVIETRKNDTLVIDPSLATSVTLQPGCAHFVLKINRKLVENKCEEAANRYIDDDIHFQLLIDNPEASRSWIETMRFLCRFYGMPNTALINNQQIHLSHAAMVANTLLYSQKHNFSALLEQDNTQSIPQHTRVACKLIEQNIKDNITMQALCDEAGVTEKTLQTAFKKHFGKTPTEFIRLRRLHYIHQALLTAGKNENVSRIMWEFGVSNPGLWAKLYRDRYGCNPSETLKSRYA